MGKTNFAPCQALNGESIRDVQPEGQKYNSVLDAPTLEAFSTFCEWVKAQDVEDLGCEKWPWRSERAYKGSQDILKGWTTRRGILGASAIFGTGEDEIILSLPLDHIGIVDFLPVIWREYYDTHILACPRRAKLLDRLMDIMVKTKIPSFSGDNWGDDEEPQMKQAKDLVLMLAYLQAHGPYEKYSDFVFALEAAYLAVYYKDPYIRTQSGLACGLRPKADFKKLVEANQLREFSVRQMMRVRREVIQRAVAKGKIEAAKLCTPHRQRDKVRTVVRNKLRQLRRSNIESQGLGAVLKAPFKVAAAPFKAIAALCDMPSRFNKACDGVVNVSDQLADDRVKNLIQKTTDASEKADDVFGMIRKALFKIKEILSQELSQGILNIILVTAVFYLYRRYESPLLRNFLVGALANLVGSRLRNIAVKFFKEDSEKHSSIDVQSGIDSGILSKMIGAMLIGTVFAAKRPYGLTGLFSHIIATMAAAPRAIKGLEGFIDTAVAMAEAGVNAIRGWLRMPHIRFANKFSSIIGDLAERIAIFAHQELTSSTGMSASQRYNKLMSFHNEVTTLLTIHSANKDVRNELETLRAKILRLAQPLRHVVGVGAGYRIQPVSLVIAGLPGIGKTAIVQALSLTLMKLCGDLPPDADLKQAEQAVFTKPANSPYMDGYQDQWCYLMDDFLQIKPVPGQDSNGITDLMTLYGGFTTMLNMAECDKKGMFPFTSKLLLMTTNCTDLTQVGVSGIILSQEAFLRRIDHHIAIVVKEEYRKPGTTELDFAKFQAAGGSADPSSLDVYPWHVWEYHDVKFNDYEQNFEPGTGKPLKELIIRVADHIKRNKTAYQQNEELFSKICKAPVTDDWIVPQGGSLNDDDDDLVILGDDDDSIIDFGDVNVVPRPARYTDSVSDMSVCSSGTCMSVSDLPPREPMIFDHPPAPTPEKSFWTDFIINKKKRPRNMYMTLPEEAQNWLTRFKQRVRDSLSTHWKQHVQIALRGCAIGIAARGIIPLAVGMVKAVYNWIKGLIFGKKSDGVETQSNAPKPRTITFRQQQSGGQIQTLWRIVYDNTFKAALDRGDGNYAVMGQILFLRGTLAVMPAHFISDLKKWMKAGEITDKTMIILRGCRQAGTGLLDSDCTVEAFLSYPCKIYEDRDLAFIHFDNSIKPRKDIMDKILFRSEIDDIGGNAVRLDTARMDRDGTFIDYNDRETFISPSVKVGRTETRIGPTVHKKWLQYHAATKKGDCGAVLCLTDHSAFACRLVAGIHVGADETWGEAYATPLDAEICRDAVSILGVRNQPEQVVTQCGWEQLGITSAEPIETMPFTDGDSTDFGSFEPFLTVSPGVAMPVRSKLEPTPMGKSEFFKEEIASFYGGTPPEPLEVMKLGFHTKDGVGVWPMAEAMRPFAGNVRIINQTKFKVALGIAMHPFNTATKDHTRRTLSYREAVCGVPSIGLKGITRQTSVGFPWVVKTKSKDKTYFFGNDQEYDLDTPEAQELERQVMELKEMIENGQRPLFVCRDFLKDEVRKRGKSARLIAGTDIRYYILCRMYFGTYVAAMMTNHRSSGICIGMNQYSEWGWLHQHMLRPGNKVWDGDFAGFDSSQQPSMLWPVLHQINDWYSKNGGGADNDVRRILFQDVAHSRHLTTVKGVATTVVEWQKSLASGAFLTAVVNSMLSMGFLVDAYIHTTGRIDFWDKASAATLGDDNLCSVADDLVHLFNQVTVSQYLKDYYGMVYTAGRKGEELKPFMSIEDVIFLQRRFAWKNGQCVCPIRPESFLHNLYYTKKGSATYKKGVVIASIEDAFQELAMHDEKQWHIVAPRLEEALLMYGATPMAETGDSTAYFELVRKRVPEWV